MLNLGDGFYLLGLFFYIQLLVGGCGQS